MNKTGIPDQETLRKLKELQQRIESLEKSKDALKTECNYLYSLLDSIPGFVFLRAPDYSIRFANSYFSEHFGEPAGRCCFEMISNRKEPCDECRLMEVFKTKKPQKWEWCNKISNRFYRIYDYPFRNIDGELLVLEYGIDITDLKEKEEQVRIISEMAQEKRRLMTMQSRQASMGEMIGNIAHQWRQPLNLISILIQNVKEDIEDGTMSKEHLDRSINKITDAIQYMSQTIDDFSNFFVPEREKIPFSVGNAINRTISFLEPQIKSSKIVIEADVPEEFLLTGYPNEYCHVLLNIIKNAKEVFAERNTIEPRIIIKAVQEEGKGIVTITDNAGGIPDNIIDKIFDPYFSTKTKENGIGIGLYMSKTIIEKNMEGKLSARNVENGAEFRIEVQCAP